MADFRTKLITLAGVATMFAGMAYGQATVGTATAATSFVRAEGSTEMIPTLNIPLTYTAATAATTANVTVYLSPVVSVTSQSSGSPAVSETVATQSFVGAGCPAAGAAVNGTVSSNSVTFSGISIGATTGACTATIAISNIRVNATNIPANGGIPGSVSAQAFVTGTNVTPAVTSAVTEAYATNGLAASAVFKGVAGDTNTSLPLANTICAAVSAANGASLNPSFAVTVSAGFAGAFKTATGEQNGSSIKVSNGTRLALTLSNVPANVAVYVPLSLTNTAGTATITLLTGNTADTYAAPVYTAPAATAVTPSSSNGLPAVAGTTKVNTVVIGNSVGAVTIANGTGTAYYEVTTQDSIVDSFAIPVVLASAAGAIPTASTSAISAGVSFASVSSTSVPQLSASSASSVSGSSYSACTTTLLFPYVTNASGFETGIAISNTSLDNFGSKGASAAASQAGTCALSFFGNATASSNPATFTTSSVSAGTSYTNILTTVAGANFTGYMLANCNFQYAHGFTYIVSGFGTSSGVAMGYVANPIPTTRTLTAGLEQLEN